MKTYSDYLAKLFPGLKVQKISVNAGFSCPNRDGTIGTGGCIYCRNDSFSPGYCMTTDSVTDQIAKGKDFFRRKYPEMKYLAYFQSYTNTHGKNISELRSLYSEALACEDIVGLVIGTRPDTLPDSVLLLLSELSRQAPVFLEIGAETSHNATLSAINRHHTWQDVVSAVSKAHESGLCIGLHLIAGLPGESKEMILDTVRNACSLPIDTLKMHQLQILKGTPLSELWHSGKMEVSPFNLDEYIELCSEIVKLVPEHIVIERFLAQSPPGLVEAPKWGLKNYQFMDMLKNILSASK